jgi:ubiquinol oxidase
MYDVMRCAGVVFADENKELLKSLPPPAVAAEYYCGSDIYMFHSFLVSPNAQCRAPKCENLHDVFQNIIDDEAEHQKTMIACQNPVEVARQIAVAKDISCDV